LKKKMQQTISEEDFTAPSDITPAYLQEKYRQGRGFTFFSIMVIVSLCGLAWLYSHYSYLRYFKPGVASFNQHQYPAAERDFQLYLRLENDPDGHYYLGRTYLATGKTTEARRELMLDGTRYEMGKWGGIWQPSKRSAPYLRQLSR
jgi:tetratricopeptide (TPR) repeat protein